MVCCKTCKKATDAYLSNPFTVCPFEERGKNTELLCWIAKHGCDINCSFWQFKPFYCPKACLEENTKR